MVTPYLEFVKQKGDNWTRCASYGAETGRMEGIISYHLFPQVQERVVRPKNDIDDLMDRIRVILVQAGRKKMTMEDRELVLRVVKALVG